MFENFKIGIKVLAVATFVEVPCVGSESQAAMVSISNFSWLKNVCFNVRELVLTASG